MKASRELQKSASREASTGLQGGFKEASRGSPGLARNFKDEPGRPPFGEQNVRVYQTVLWRACAAASAEPDAAALRKTH